MLNLARQINRLSSRLSVSLFQPSPLFTKLEPSQVAEWKRKFGSNSTDTESAADQKNTKAPAAKKQKTDKKMKDNNKSKDLILKKLDI